MYRTKREMAGPYYIGRRQKVSLFLLSNKRQDNQVSSFLLYTIERKTKSISFYTIQYKRQE
jgi:hypothetical protein